MITNLKSSVKYILTIRVIRFFYTDISNYASKAYHISHYQLFKTNDFIHKILDLVFFYHCDRKCLNLPNMNLPKRKKW